MVDSTGDLVDAIYDMRARQAILVHALRQLGGEITLNSLDVYEAAGFDVHLRALPGGVTAKLEPCRA